MISGPAGKETPVRPIRPGIQAGRVSACKVRPDEAAARWRVRAAAISAALAVNALILSLVILTARRDAPAPAIAPRAIDIVLVAETPEPEPESEPQIEAEPEPDLEDISEPEAGPDPVAVESPVSSEPRSDTPDATAPPPAAPEDENDAVTGGGAPVFIVPPVSDSTASVLGAIRCASTADANRELAPCPDDGRPGNLADGLPFARMLEGPPDTLASFTSPISAAEIRALFGDVPHQLAGQPTLGDTSMVSPSYSSADGMRDQLPPMVPDPAFGN